MSRSEFWCLSISVITTLLLPTTITAYSFHIVVNASVLGTNESNYADLYSSIAEIFLRQPSTDNTSLGYVPNYCKLIFNAVNFDTSSGDAMYNSLEAGVIPLPPNDVTATTTKDGVGDKCKVTTPLATIAITATVIHDDGGSTATVVREIADNNKARLNFEDRSVAVAVGPFTEVFASTEYVITQQTHILTSAAGQYAGVMDPGRVVSLLPEPSSLAKAIAATVKQLGWNDVAFLAQDDFSPVLSLGLQGLQVWPLRLPNAISESSEAELHKNLLELRQSSRGKYILHSTDIDVVTHVLNAANKLHMSHHSIEWFITYPDFEDLIHHHLRDWPGSLYGLQLLKPDKIPTNISHLLTGNISRLDLGLAVDVVGLLRHIIWSEWPDCSRELIVKDYIIPPEAFTWQMKHNIGPTNPYHGALGQYTWGKYSNVRTNFTIDILMYESAITKIGTIVFEFGVPTVTLQKPPVHFYARTADVFGKDEVLRIVTKQTEPFIIKRGDNYTGYSHDLLLYLAEKVGFKYELFEAEDQINQSGALVNGMVHALLTGDASMAVGALEVTADREKVISFSYTILSSKASILIKKGESDINFFQFLGPFSADLWLMIVVFMVIAGASLYYMSRYDPTQRGAIRHFDLKESLWYSLTIFLQGSTDYSPQTTAMRTVIAFFWFCVLIIEAAYTANLAAFLTLQQIDERVKSVYDLAGQTKIKYGVEKGSEMMAFFKAQQEDPYQRMWSIMKGHEAECVLANRTEILDKVKAGKLAFISDGVVNDYYANQHCGIESIEQFFQIKDFSIGLPQGVAYLDDINQALLELREEGVLDYLKEKWWAVGMNCTDERVTWSISQKSTAELELTNMIGVFIVLAVFIILAVIVHVGEKLFKRNRMKRRQNHIQMNQLPEAKECENHFV